MDRKHYSIANIFGCCIPDTSSSLLRPELGFCEFGSVSSRSIIEGQILQKTSEHRVLKDCAPQSPRGTVICERLIGKDTEGRGLGLH